MLRDVSLTNEPGSLEDELVRLTARNDDLLQARQQDEALKQRYQELQVRHNAALEMIGEKDEALEV